MQVSEDDGKSIAKWVMATSIMMMLSSNVYFIKRLVDKIDSTEQTVYALREEIATLKGQISDLQYRKKWGRE